MTDEYVAVICGGYRLKLPKFMAWRYIGVNGISEPDFGLWSPSMTYGRHYSPVEED